eukprot:398471-Prymnesium_polylepis.1
MPVWSCDRMLAPTRGSRHGTDRRSCDVVRCTACPKGQCVRGACCAFSDAFFRLKNPQWHLERCPRSTGLRAPR